MRLVWRCLVAFGALQLGTASHAQIYTCTAPDGTRIFSDQRCGPDAKVVPNITTKKRATGSTPRAKVEPKSTAELDALLEQCNAGDIKACNAWTRGGGPNSLREKEQAAEQACAAGSLADCEYRYCADGLNEECRNRVLQTAKVTGSNWYLRDAGRRSPDGLMRYEVRCIPAGVRILREVTITCDAQAGPARCGDDASTQRHAQLDLAAQASCAR